MSPPGPLAWHHLAATEKSRSPSGYSLTFTGLLSAHHSFRIWVPLTASPAVRTCQAGDIDLQSTEHDYPIVSILSMRASTIPGMGSLHSAS